MIDITEDERTQDPFEGIERPEEVEPEDWKRFKFLFGIIWAAWKEAAKNPEPGPDCLSGETILAYTRHLLPMEQAIQVLEHLAGCPYCSVRLMEIHKQERLDAEAYKEYLSGKLGIQREELERMIEVLAERSGDPPETVAGMLAIAEGLGCLDREELLEATL